MSNSDESESVQAIAIDSVAPYLPTQEVQIGFSRNNAPVLVVHLPASSIGTLMVRLVRCSHDLSQDVPREVDLVQPMRLQNAFPAVLANGEKVLRLGIAGIQIPLLLTDSEIHLLQNTLLQMVQVAPDRPLN